MRATEALHGGGALFFRDALRGARRWQTWGMRTGVSFFLFLSLFLMLAEAFRDRSGFAVASPLGRELFVGYAMMLLVLGGGLAPVLVGSGIAEERDDATLQLLALTRLTATQIVFGKVLSRLFAVLLLVLGGMPILVVCTAFGGVSVWEVVNATVNILLVVTLLGGLGGLVGLHVRGPATMFGVAAVYALVAFVALPELYRVLHGGAVGSQTHVSPPWGVLSNGPAGLLPTLALAPTAIGLIAWSGPLFAHAVLDHEESARALEHRQAQRIRATIGWTGLLAVIALPVIVVLGPAVWSGPPLPLGVTSGLGFVWVGLVDVGLAGLLVLLVRESSLLRARWLRGRFEAAQRARRPRWLRGAVWGHPVVWREALTGSSGPSVIGARWLLVLWLGLGAWVFVTVDVSAGAVLLATSGTLIAGVLTVSLATESTQGERRGRTLPLLLMSRLSGSSIVAGKLAAIGLIALPYLWLGWGVLIATASWSTLNLQSSGSFGGVCPSTSALSVALIATAILILAWLLAAWAWIALTAIWGGLSLGPQSSWALNTALMLVFFLVPLLAAAVLPRDAAEIVGTLFVPPFFVHELLQDHCGLSPWVVASTVLHAGFALFVFVIAARRVRVAASE